MFLDSPDRMLNIYFRIKHERGSNMVYATTGNLRCFECGDVGHKRQVCPHKERGQENIGQGPGIEGDTQVKHTGQKESSGFIQVSQSETDMPLNIAKNISEMEVIEGQSSNANDDAGKGKETLAVEQDNECNKDVVPSTSVDQHGCDTEKNQMELLMSCRGCFVR